MFRYYESPARIIGIDQLLTDSVNFARQELLDAGFSNEEIDICVTRWPNYKYERLRRKSHPLIIDDKHRMDIAAIQHAEYLQACLENEGNSTREFISDGYALAWMHFQSTAPARFLEVSPLVHSELQKRYASPNRVRKPYMDELIRKFHEKYGSPDQRGIKAFHRFLSRENFSDIGVYVERTKNSSGRWVYIVKGINDNVILDSVRRDSVNDRLKQFESGEIS